MLAPVLAAALLSLVSPEPDPPGGVEALAWISGCWMQTRPDGFVEEHWTKPAGGTLLGMSRTVKAGRTSEYEFLQIRDVDGRLAYVAKPSGQAEDTFPMKSMTDAQVVFEDPKHDFPQRIIYWQDRPGILRARIEGTLNGKLEFEEWTWKADRLAR